MSAHKPRRANRCFRLVGSTCASHKQREAQRTGREPDVQRQPIHLPRATCRLVGGPCGRGSRQPGKQHAVSACVAHARWAAGGVVQDFLGLDGCGACVNACTAAMREGKREGWGAAAAACCCIICCCFGSGASTRVLVFGVWQAAAGPPSAISRVAALQHCLE